ncbi:MAG: DUF2281 domain-containing protein [Verrucomicrobiaceae bacterium]|nr:DUF2281 domain-containing protein [Verrucomicrobiaceae bacterium]
MNLTVRICEKIALLPQHAVTEVLDFADFLVVRYGDAQPQEEGQKDAATFYARFQADLSGHRFNRNEANAR